MEVITSNYRIAHGVLEARALIASLYDQPGSRPDLVYGISNMDTLERYFPEYSTDFGNPARMAAGVNSRLIYTSIKGPIYGRSDTRLHRQSRYLPPEELDGCTDLTIVGNTVVFMSATGTQMVSQSITNAALAAQMTSFFNFLWNHAS